MSKKYEWRKVVVRRLGKSFKAWRKCLKFDERKAHYLTCQDENCKRKSCVDRRENHGVEDYGSGYNY